MRRGNRSTSTLGSIHEFVKRLRQLTAQSVSGSTSAQSDSAIILQSECLRNAYPPRLLVVGKNAIRISATSAIFREGFFMVPVPDDDAILEPFPLTSYLEDRVRPRKMKLKRAETHAYGCWSR